MTKLEQAKSKLERIQREQDTNMKAIREEHKNLPFGQPNIIGRPDIYRSVKQKYKKAFKLADDVEKQENRIDMLEAVEDFKNENELLKDVHVVGKTAYATIGARTSVNNLEYFKNQLVELEAQNKEAKEYNKTKPAILKKTVGAKITKLKSKIATLEEMEKQDKMKVLSEKSQSLIDSGAVNQWKKKPIYYFVKGLKKVALELDKNGDFYISSRYSANTEDDENFVSELLK